DNDGHFSYMSPAAERITGRTLDDFRMRYTAYITDHPANQRIIENTERSMRNGESFPPHELEIYHKNGSRITLEIVERPHVEDGRVTGIVGVARDVTERKRMQSELRLAKFSVDHAADAALWVAPDGSVEYANESVCECLGYTRREALRLKIHDIDLLTPEETWPERWRELTSASRVVGESIYRTKGGREFPVDVIVNHLEFEGREYAIVVARDITERKQAESALRESERRTRAIIDSAIDAVVVMDQRGAILEWNPQAELTFGWTAEEAIGRQLSDLIVPESMIRDHAAGFERFLSHDDASTLNRRIELTARNRNGEEFPVEIAVTTHKHHDEYICSAFIRDLTMRKKLEHETTRAQKLESVGILAGGIAHDFNNLLSGVLGNVSMALRNEEVPKDTAMYLSEAERALVKASGLTQQLLTFSKGGNPVKKSVSIAELVVDSISFALRGSSVKPVFTVADDLRLAEVDSGQISQALHNLAINAKQAMPNGGRLIVEAANIEFDGGPGIELIISDQGVGIPESNLSKIFDPYFTTKATGNGLGLATTYSIIKKHGGVIEVDSQVGIGATFRLRLPATDACAPRVTPKSRQELRGEGRILVMDDEDFLRTLAERMISGFGYTVDTAAEG
ncbi:MAG TPA: PAS domain S-box protein, partial [candidate division Zixibacteria bacterium]|nr:PAS domain S-box protein [candidate division Zixibacteria bacterium]